MLAPVLLGVSLRGGTEPSSTELGGTACMEGRVTALSDPTDRRRGVKTGGRQEKHWIAARCAPRGPHALVRSARAQRKSRGCCGASRARSVRPQPSPAPTLTGHACACRRHPPSAWPRPRCSGGTRPTAPLADLGKGKGRVEVRGLSPTREHPCAAVGFSSRLQHPGISAQQC